jgi:hypothetical protein
MRDPTRSRVGCDLDAAHFASCTPNPVPFTEYKGSADIPISSESSTLIMEGGMVRVPSGPGFGVTIDADREPESAQAHRYRTLCQARPGRDQGGSIHRGIGAYQEIGKGHEHQVE